ncbi:hypothetical protein LRY65_02265 [Candidatus Woesebacteria bacterium]|nr:hypothetical protein [Candidatus Woesebacteria bacterium]MCD8507297.1 hypothetical protein [Candidatus Woesebacteria bacterium]MCD8527017.1 hypothetical protein [Candidatus Woesebacteria bacterium]MCD8546746.1 hypothetical protein [Candidatus Woesebacteria bacterium]
MPSKKSSSDKETTTPMWIQLYFVLASLVGLVILIIGSSVGLNALLSQYVFPLQPRTSAPPVPYVLQKTVSDAEGLTVEEQQLLDQWEQDYQRWLEEDSKIDYELENRKRTYATALAMILVGGPVFLIHVPFVFRQIKK